MSDVIGAVFDFVTDGPGWLQDLWIAFANLLGVQRDAPYFLLWWSFEVIVVIVAVVALI